MSRLRVVNLGLPKTGTTTLGHALKLSGLRVADHRIRPRQTADAALHDAFVGDLLYRGYFQTGDPLALLDDFEGFAEINVLRPDRSLWPQTDWGLIAAIRAHHPGTRFVATRRRAFDTSQSMVNWGDLGLARIPQSGIPGLPPGYGETSRERMQWIEAHYEHLAQLFTGADDFLELPVAAPDAAARLAAHIGRDITWWGRANASEKAG